MRFEKRSNNLHYIRKQKSRYGDHQRNKPHRINYEDTRAIWQTNENTN